jgi:hypothetical protein
MDRFNDELVVAGILVAVAGLKRAPTPSRSLSMHPAAPLPWARLSE